MDQKDFAGKHQQMVDKQRRLKAAGHTEDTPCDNHLSEDFKRFVQEKYRFPSPNLIKSPDVLYMLYALEGFEVPRSNHLEQVMQHPQLTADDQIKIHYISKNHNIENALCFGLASVLFWKQMDRVFKRPLFKVVPVMLSAFAFSYLTNRILFEPLVKNEIVDNEMAQYLELDMDEQMMREDVHKLGVQLKT